MQELLLSLRRYRRGLSSLTVLAIFSTLNFIFALTKTSFYLVFSPFLPLFSYELGRAFTAETGDRTPQTVGIFLSLCFLALWFFLRFRANGRSRVMRAATLYYAVDTAVLAFFSLRYQYPVGRVDILFHAMALISLLLACRAGRRIDAAPAPTPELLEEMLLNMSPPPEGLPVGTEVGDAPADDRDSRPLRPVVPRRRCFFDTKVFELRIRVLRSHGLTELCINDEVYAEVHGVYELTYSLTATVSGHRVTVRLSPGRFYGRMILVVDGRLVAEKRRYI